MDKTLSERDLRFDFGANWERFIANLTEKQIIDAEESLKSMLKMETLKGMGFLDIGNGSGLFSLAAKRLGADFVHSFDFDRQSVNCALELKRRYFPDSTGWKIDRGSVLDQAYLEAIRKFDIVYSWGVLHHTGDMWQALENSLLPLKADGLLFISIYNDQGSVSRFWNAVKKTYNILPRILKFFVLLTSFLLIYALKMVGALVGGRLREFLEQPGHGRGMSRWRDHVDWVGGYPFETARPEEIVDFYLSKGLQLRRLKTVGGGHGCNEFVFQNG